MIRSLAGPTILLAGGGTGGHLFPGFALAEEIGARAPSATVLLACTERDRHAAHGANCPLETVRVDSPRRPAGPLGIAQFGARMAGAVRRALSVLRDTRATAVVGLGGYGSVAPVLAARLLGVPVLLLEQNAVPGAATRFLSRFAQATAGSFPGIEELGVRGRVEPTGNPLRTSVLATRRAHGEFGLSPDRPVLAVLGGSLGARSMSLRLADALGTIREAAPEFQVIHQSGSFELAAELRTAYAANGVTAAVQPFFRDMAAVYGTADLALCRAGGTTVAEVAAIGLPCVFVPYPHHSDGHQRENARALVEGGAATLIEEHALTPAVAAAEIAPLLRDARARAERARAARRIGRPDAARRVVDLLFEICRLEPAAAAPGPALAGAKGSSS